MILNGATLKAEAGGTFTVGAKLTTNASGELVNATSCQNMVGIAREAGADGRIVSFVSARGSA